MTRTTRTSKQSRKRAPMRASAAVKPTKPTKPTKQPTKKPAKKPAKQPTKKPAKQPAKQPATRLKNRRSAARKPARQTRPRGTGKTAKRPAGKSKHGPGTGGAERWIAFVEKHGVVLASARGPVPSVAEAVAGEPIVGSWWSHPRAGVIFDALSSLDDSADIRCFKLVDHKITLVHRRRWPALAKLAEAGVVSRDRVESIQQEHMPTGEHRNFTTPYPDWVPEEVAAAACGLSVEQARAELGDWI